MSTLRLDGKRIAVTGGASGIGLATARRCVALGATVALLDLADRDNHADGDGLCFVRCDVTDGEGTRDALAEAGRALGGALDGVFHTLRGAVPAMSPAGGSIVATSSIAGTRTFGTGGTAAYAAAKAGVVALCSIAAVELGRLGIRVNCIAPGQVATAFLGGIETRGLERLAHERRAGIPLRDGTTSADDVAGLVAFLLSDAAAKVSGTLIPVDGAQSLLGGGVMKAPS